MLPAATPQSFPPCRSIRVAGVHIACGCHKSPLNQMVARRIPENVERHVPESYTNIWHAYRNAVINQALRRAIITLANSAQVAV